MVEYSIGQIVIGRAGRDKGKFLLIIELNDDYIYLVDGKSRKMEKPKVKKKKHVQCVDYIDKSIGEKLSNNQKISNSDIRKAIEIYMTGGM